MADTSASVVRPEKSAHCKAPLLSKVVTNDGQPILGEEVVELPLGHCLVVSLVIPGIIQWHLEVGASTHLLLCCPLGVGLASIVIHSVSLSLLSRASSLMGRCYCPQRAFNL